MKKIYKVLLTCMLVCVLATNVQPTSTKAEEIETKEFGDFTYSVREEKGEQCIYIESYKGKDKDIVYPDTIEGLPVRAVVCDYNDFETLNNIETMTFPKTVTNISTSFCMLKNLKDITVEEGNSVYYSIDGVLYEKGVRCLYGGTGIDLAAYPVAKEGESFKIPTGICGIGLNGFINNKYLKSVNTNEVEIVGSFDNSNIETVITGAKAQRVSGFANCKNLSTVKLGKNVYEIDDSAFLGCTSLTSITLPANLCSIRDAAFHSTGLSKVTIPAKVYRVGQKAFDETVKITKQSYLTTPPENSNATDVYRAYAIINNKKYYAKNITKITSAKSVSLKKNQKKTLSVTGYYSGQKKGTMKADILSFKSSDTSVVAVNKNGKVTAKKKGTAKITISFKPASDYIKVSSITVTVKVK